MIKPIAFLAAFLAVSPAFADDLVLRIGQVSVLSPGGKIATVVVGNPEVADVAVEGETTVMVMARKVGQTDVVLLDANRQVLQTNRVIVAVSSVSDHVTVRRVGAQGVVVETQVCTPGAGCYRADGK